MTNSSAYQSGEFLIVNNGSGVGDTTGAQASAVVFDNTLWIAAMLGYDPVSSFMIGFATIPLEVDPNHPRTPIEIERGYLADQGNWSFPTVTIPGATDGLWTWAAPSLSANSTSLFLFWNNGDTYQAAQYNSPQGGGTPAWQEKLTLLSSDTSNPKLPVGDEVAPISSIPFGENVVIVAFGNTTNSKSYVGAYHIEDIDNNAKTWKARSGMSFNAASVLSLAWFNSGPLHAQSSVPPVTQASEQAPPCKLWIAGDPNHPTTVVTLTENGDIDTSGGQGVSYAYWQTPATGSVARDPAGRIAVYESATELVNRSLYNTAQAARTNEATPLPLINTTPMAAYNSTGYIASAYFTDTANVSSASLDGSTGQAYPVYEFVFYLNENSLYGQVNRYGTAQAFPNYRSVQPKPKKEQTMIIGGIIDGPIPIPNVNIANASFSGSETEFASVGYGISKTSTVERSVFNSWTAGFKTEGSFTKGIGPAWDVSLNGGTGSVHSNGTTTSLSSAMISTSILDEATKGIMGKQAVLPAGQVFGVDITMTWAAFRFLDASGTAVVDNTADVSKSHAPLFTTVSSTANPGQARSYTPYAVVPGELDSYTIESLNARMKALGYSGDYFHEVVKPNAYPFTATQSYLSYAWDNGGGERTQEYERVTTNEIESSWTFELDAYVGVSGGGGVDLFGDGEEAEFKFLIGGTYSHEASATTTNDDGWTVGLESSGMKLPDVEATPGSKVVTSYSFRLYYLPIPAKSSGLTPNYWVKELKRSLALDIESDGNLNPDDIDVHACAWKVIFIVDNYQLADGTSYSAPSGS